MDSSVIINFICLLRFNLIIDINYTIQSCNGQLNHKHKLTFDFVFGRKIFEIYETNKIYHNFK